MQADQIFLFSKLLLYFKCRKFTTLNIIDFNSRKWQYKHEK